jgi:hypothetical protein
MVVALLASDLHFALIMPSLAGGLEEILREQLPLLVEIVGRSLQVVVSHGHRQEKQHT